MDSKEAKDFLIRQTERQAAVQGVPFSDLEKRMMYFSETNWCPENPIALNEAFEAEYDKAKYEAKVSKLMHDAYRRIRKESPEITRQWNDAIKVLSKEDHYLLVLWDQGPKDRTLKDSFRLFGAGIVLAAAIVALCFLAAHYGILPRGSSRRYVAPSGVSTSMPLWLQRLFWFFIVGGYLYFVILPWILKKRPQGQVSVFSKLFRRQNKTGTRD